MTRAVGAFAVLLSAMVVSCSVSEHEARTCDDTTPCPGGQTCFRGFCVGDSPDGGPCMDGAFCYEGPAGTSTMGRCRAGTLRCNDDGTSTCVGQQLPQEETCNMLDDDCDGSDDELDDTGCSTGMLGRCEAGVRTCLDDGGERCVQLETSVDEIPCNEIDDDCDGNTDEFDEPRCYDGAMGCDEDFNCVGLCAPGEKACDGTTEVCLDAVVPAATDGPEAETCDGADNDCDGNIDEECTCTPAATGPCYGGPAGTVGIGECVVGTRTCQAGGTWGDCEDDVTPAMETCANLTEDNDCDELVDENVGFTCPTGELGVCANGTQMCVSGVAQCVAPDESAELCNNLDDDCDGPIDEAFSLSDDEMNCGTCGVSCTGSRDTCCASSCVDTRGNTTHCGACGNTCDPGEVCCNGACRSPAECAGCEGGCSPTETCCNGVCVDLATDEDNCGACDDPCSSGQFCCGSTCVAGNDRNNCGDACSTCGGDQLCCGGSCTDRTTTQCSSCTSGCAGGECCVDESMGMCIDTNTDPMNCGGCGDVCPAGQGCRNGSCCTMCAGSCVNTNTSASHCGGCNRFCALGCCGGSCCLF